MSRDIVLIRNFLPFADESLKYEELMERLGMPEEDLMRTLHSLACAKYHILNKVPEGRTVAKGDVYSINRKFVDRMRRIKVCPDLE